ncbi:MAG: hypothetical protein Q4F49_04065 [Pseudoxanthomonas suwonensis]|nr:hypothetical protein [Pseudoxanthomonas suwonensis]
MTSHTRLLLPLALLFAATATGCKVEVKEPAAARVDCGTPGPHGVDCQVVRTGGPGAFEACWDLEISCQNNGVMTGASCHQVADGVPSGTQNMPVASFRNTEACDVPTSGQVRNLKITPRG